MENRLIEAACPTCHQGRLVVNHRWLRLRREAAGILMREFARKVGLSAAYISDIELGRRNCRPEILTQYEALVPKK